MDVQIKYLARVVCTVNESLICFTNIRKLGSLTVKILPFGKIVNELKFMFQ